MARRFFDVTFHGYPEGAVVVVPGKVNDSILGALIVLGDIVVIFRTSWIWRAWCLPKY